MADRNGRGFFGQLLGQIGLGYPPQYPEQCGRGTTPGNKLALFVARTYLNNPVDYLDYMGDVVQFRARIHSIELNGSVLMDRSSRTESPFLMCWFDRLEQLTGFKQRDTVIVKGNLDTVEQAGPRPSQCVVNILATEIRKDRFL